MGAAALAAGAVEAEVRDLLLGAALIALAMTVLSLFMLARSQR